MWDRKNMTQINIKSITMKERFRKSVNYSNQYISAFINVK